MATSKVAKHAPVKTDVGPLLVEAARSIDGGTTNPAIEAKIAKIVKILAENEIPNRSWVGKLLYQVRGIHQGIAADTDRFFENLAIGGTSGALGPRASRVLREIANQAKAASKSSKRVSGSIGMKPRSIGVGGIAGAVLDNVRGEAKKSSAPRRPVRTDNGNIDKAIEAADVIGKMPLPEPLKSAINGLKSVLKIDRAHEQKKGTAPEYVAETSKIAKAMVTVVAEIVKWGASNAELAEQAAVQLGKIASFLNVVGKVFDGIKHLRTLLSRTATANQKADALVGLIGLAGPIGLAAEVSAKVYRALFNLIAAPILDDTKAIGKMDLERVLGGKTPEQLKAEIEALPTSPDKAKWVIRKLHGETFTGESRFNTSYSIAELWARYRSPVYNTYRIEIDQIYAEDRSTSGTPAKLTNGKLTEIAAAYKVRALAFIDLEVEKLAR